MNTPLALPAHLSLVARWQKLLGERYDFYERPARLMNALEHCTGARYNPRLKTIGAYRRPNDRIYLRFDRSHERPLTLHQAAYILAHEAIHWTGAEGRLDRLPPCEYYRQGWSEHAAEEITAEWGAVMLCGLYGVPVAVRAGARVKRLLSPFFSPLRSFLLGLASSHAIEAVEFLLPLLAASPFAPAADSP